MVEPNNVLIKMEGVKKVFYTDEVETHALEEIHLEIPSRAVCLDLRPIGLR